MAKREYSVKLTVTADRHYRVVAEDTLEDAREAVRQLTVDLVKELEDRNTRVDTVDATAELQEGLMYDWRVYGGVIPMPCPYCQKTAELTYQKHFGASAWACAECHADIEEHNRMHRMLGERQE